MEKGWLLDTVVVIELRTKNRTCFLYKQRLKPAPKENARKEDERRARERAEKRAAREQSSRLRLSDLSGSRASAFERRLGQLEEDEEEVSSRDTPSDIVSDKTASETSETPTFAEVVLHPVADDRQQKREERDNLDSYGGRDPHDPRKHERDYLGRDRSPFASRLPEEQEKRRPDPRDRPATYVVEVRTGRAAGAGTDANVFVTLFGNVPVPRATPRDSGGAPEVSEFDRIAPQAGRYGPRVSPKLPLRTPILAQTRTDGAMFGESREHFGSGLGSRGAPTEKESASEQKSSQDMFQTGARDRFEHTLPKWLGRLERIRIEHDNAGLASDWFLEKVCVYFALCYL